MKSKEDVCHENLMETIRKKGEIPEIINNNPEDNEDDVSGIISGEYGHGE